MGEVKEIPSNSLWEHSAQGTPKAGPEHVSNPDTQMGTQPSLPKGPLRGGGGGHY